MIGQAWPRPGIGVCQRIFSPDSTFHVTGAGSSETPLACGPRNCGQFTVEADRLLWVNKAQPKMALDHNSYFRDLIWIDLTATIMTVFSRSCTGISLGN